jgi:two-component system, LytTR family, response regulator
MKALILDDELYCAEALFHLIKNHCPEIVTAVYFTDPDEALAYIDSHTIDILFLDVEMPMLSGFDFLQKTRNFNGALVFTTAYEAYAVKAFQVDAIGYLLKPIDRQELIKTVDKIIKSTARLTHNELLSMISNLVTGNSNHEKKLPIHHADGIHLINPEHIIRCESDGSYSRIFMKEQKTMMASKNLKELEELIHTDSFFRIHKSHLINLNHIKFVSRHDGGDVVMSDDSTVPISRSVKQDFLKRFK